MTTINPLAERNLEATPSHLLDKEIFTPRQKSLLAKAASGLKSCPLLPAHVALQKPADDQSSQEAKILCPLKTRLCPQCHESIFDSTAQQGTL